MLTRFSFYKKPGFLGVRPQIWPKVKKPTKKLEASIFRVQFFFLGCNFYILNHKQNRVVPKLNAILQYNLSGSISMECSKYVFIR